MKFRKIIILLTLIIGNSVMVSGADIDTEIVNDYVVMEDSDTQVDVDGGVLYFNSQSGNITGCSNGITKLVIPEKINGVDVVGISDMAFWKNEDMTDVVIPGSVKKIGLFAFNSCSVLKNVEIKSGVENIGSFAFSDNALIADIHIPSSVTVIGMGAFVNNIGLESVTMSRGVASIGDLAFSGCTQLREVQLPDTITDMIDTAFKGCINLNKVYCIQNSLVDDMKWYTSGNVELAYINEGDFGVKLAAPAVNWLYPMVASWRLSDYSQDEEQKYEVKLYSGDTVISDSSVVLPVDKDMHTIRCCVDYSAEMTAQGEGEYYYEVTALGSGDKANSDVVKSTVYYHTDKEEGSNYKIKHSEQITDKIYILTENKPLPYEWKYELSGDGIVELDNTVFYEDYFAEAEITEGMPGEGSVAQYSFVPVAAGVVDITFTCVSTVGEGTLYKIVYTYEVDDNLNVKFVESKEVTEQYSYGDMDGDGILTAADASILLQKVLNGSYKMPIEDMTSEYKKLADVDGDGELTAGDSAEILQKVLNGSYIFTVER